MGKKQQATDDVGRVDVYLDVALRAYQKFIARRHI